MAVIQHERYAKIPPLFGMEVLSYAAFKHGRMCRITTTHPAASIDKKSPQKKCGLNRSAALDKEEKARQ